ncbi:hypothetical protein BRD15_02860 [Halobacteriales archaeon SW_6_65_15]|nr:MAG: hypothetical protein BRD15_02860 [Halobacteriales archaeon SW_6_65_15]
MPDNNISRRDVIKATGGAVAVAGASGVAGAKELTEYNVGFSAASGRRAAVGAAGGVEREFDSIDAMTIRASQEAAKGLAKRKDVRYVEENAQMHALSETLPWGVDRVDGEVLHANGETGNGADIAILDTGIDSDHPDLQANLQGGKNFADDACGEAGGLFCSTNSNTCHYAWDDDNDHGTHCAGTANGVDNTEGVIGVSTEANLWAGKVLNGCGSGSYSNIAAGIEWAADQGFDVASLSLGGDASSVVKDACTYAYNNGVLLVAAAGNDGECTDCVGYPAAYEECIAVSATTPSDSLASYSSTGPEVEIAAPGGASDGDDSTSVYSTIPGGYDYFNGTSMATPHVSGAGGQLMANGYSNTEARSRLQNTAEDIGLASNEQGHGLLDAAAALGYDSSDDLGDGGGGDGGDGDTAPTIDTFEVTNNSNGGWARFNVDWAVSDADGDLSSVDLTLSQSGSTVDSASNSVSGSSASGSDRLQDKKGSGSYDVTLTVTDSNGNTASQTKTVSA